MNKCIALNVGDNAQCKFLCCINSQYCGMHKSKEHYENCLEKKKNRGAMYYKKNKEILNEKNRKYYINNIDKFKQYITCECGTDILRMDYIRHSKSNKHNDLLKIINLKFE